MAAHRRPADYDGSAGWQTRILGRTVAGAIAGLGCGLVGGALHGRALAPATAAVASNFVIATSMFSGMQELVRELRFTQPNNMGDSLLAGLASGAALGGIQGGRARVLPMALLFAGIGTGAQWGYLELQEMRLRRLTAMLSDEVPSQHLHEDDMWRWPDWLPVKIFDEEQTRRRQEEFEEDIRMRQLAVQSRGLLEVPGSGRSRAT